MKFIDTKTHGYMDYFMGMFLIVAPWIFKLDPGAPEGLILIVLGALAIIYSLMTRYELGMVKAISMKAHLTIDILSGIILAASPWLFGFTDRIYLPHLILGIIEICSGAFTKATPVPQNTKSHNNFG